MNQRTRIKICGVSREADVDAAVDAGADAVGFVFHPESPRYLSVDRATRLADAQDAFADVCSMQPTRQNEPTP